MRGSLIAQKRYPGAGHDDDHVEFAALQPLNKVDGLALIIESALLDRRRDEWIAPLPADEGFHFLGAATFQAENAESCKWHVLERGKTFLQSKT